MTTAGRIITHCQRRGLGVAICLAAVLAAGASEAQSKRQITTRQIHEEAIKLLAEEARQAKADLALPTETPDFADRFDREMDPADILRTIARRGNRDPFIDAYIRWQFTSFDVSLPDLDDRNFARLMDEAPIMIENPKADQSAIALLDQYDRAGELSPENQERVRGIEADLNEKERIALAMNRPAREFRMWVAKQLGETGPRPRQWMVEELSATVRAGWPARTIKGRISREFSASVNDETFTPPQREMVMRQLATLVKPGRVWLNRITYFATGEIRLAKGSSEVNKGDVENWYERLAGR